MWPTVRLHFSRRFRICAWFGRIRFYRSNARKTGFYRSDMTRSPKIDDSWHVAHYFIACLERITNLYLVWPYSESSEKCNRTRGHMSLLVDLEGCMSYLTAFNRFDVDWTGKMTEFDQTKHRFGIPTKIFLTNNRVTHGSWLWDLKR